MTPRERVITALEHREPDKIPIDFSGHRSSGIAAIAYPKIRKVLGLPPRPIRVYDIVQQLAVVDDDVLDRFGVDTIELGRGFALDEKSWQPWVLPDGTDCLVPAWINIKRETGRWVIKSTTGTVLAHMPDGTLYFEQTFYPLAENDDTDDLGAAIRQSMWTSIACPPGPVDSQTLSEGAKKLRQRTARAILGLFGGNLFEMGQFFYRADRFMMMLAAEPKKAHRFLDKLVELHLTNLERYLAAVGRYIDIIVFGDDLGMQTGPLISPKMYREFFMPRHTVLWNRAKQLANVKVMLHCCGGIRELLPDLIEAGLDAINPVQITCRGMNPAELKTKFGKDITFWGGGCNTQDVLPNASPHQVAGNVRRLVRIFSPGGGFVFQQVHNILANVPPQNVVAMFDAVNECVAE